MNEKYHRLCAEDRKVIYNMNKAGFGQVEIAQSIGFSQPTVSKELSRNKGQRGYRAKQADDLAKARQSLKTTRKKVMTGEIQQQVEARLLLNHSPDQISKKLALQGVIVSHESIYCHVRNDRKSGGSLWKHLRINGTRRYRRRNKVGRVGKIKDRVDIDDRPSEVEKRIRYGDWEADLIQGGGWKWFFALPL